MLKRIVTICLAALLLVGALMPAHADAAYENTHVNTGNQRADIIAIAATQIGYSEGAGGYSKYGDYHGNPYGDWCGYFVSWCARQAGVSTSVLKKQGWAAASKWGLSTFTASQRLPQPGDLYFRGTAHVGFVYYTSGNYFYTIEGNSVGDAVVSRALNLYSSSYSFASPNYAGSNNYNHTHTIVSGYDSGHPHKEYEKCTGCDYKTYTGGKKILDDCTQCIQDNCSHAYSAWESTGSSNHKSSCPKCGKTLTESHDWRDIKIIKEASCKESGSKEQSCADCGANRTVTIKRTDDHKYGEWEYYNRSYHIRKCSVCGKNDLKSHNVDEEGYVTDGEKHWHECVDCKEKYDEAEHTFPGNCVSACEVCDYLRPGGHPYEDLWYYDENEHWQICETCDDKTLPKPHEFDNDCDTRCNICAYTREVEHAYSDELQMNSEGSWYECDNCGSKKDFTKHKPGPKASEKSAQLCKDCGYEIAPIVEHVHDFGPYATDGNTHWGTCRCGEAMVPENHSWDLATGSCSVCGMASVQQAPTQNWDFVWLIMAGAVVTTAAVTTAVMVNKGKKRKGMQMA